MMDITPGQVLGLSDKEKKVYDALSVDEPQSVTKVGKEAGIPRMTAHYALQRFLERGLAERIKRDNQFLYTKVSFAELAKDVLLPEGEISSGALSVPVGEEVDLVVYKGFEEILQMYEKISANHPHKRLKTIQTTASTDHIYANFSIERLDEVHKIMNEHDIIVEDVVEKDFFAPMYKHYPDDFKAAAESFLGRTTVTYALPENYIDFTTDMAIFDDLVVFIDWAKPVAIVVRTDQIVAMCLSFYGILKSKAEKIQFRELAKPYLEKVVE
jgi:DNA-binding Lrp family transcriptional regulator